MCATVFVAGATGVLGRRLVDRLTDVGYGVVGLVRDDAGAESVRSGGGLPHRGDVLDRGSIGEGVEGADVVINAATAIPTGTKPTAAEWERNDRIRREGTRNLAVVAAAEGVDRFVQQSVVWVARQSDGSAFDERAEPTPDRTTESAVDAERIAREVGRDGVGDVTVLRGGWFYAPDSAQTRAIAESLLSGEMPIVGGGLLGRRDAVVSTIHADDAATAYVRAIEDGASGTFHVDDRPVTVATFLRTFADALDAPEPRRVPGWLARFAVGRDTVRFLTSSMPTTNDRFREVAAWEPTYPTVEEGVAAIVERWGREGYPFETEAG
ncbi:NAD-dependent epimerase/dehydratase family protein [Natronorarus salvus]|uniref:NAD-dependent epimerase/dehydratase family protein n=1 Tax=Natronorarus salvus TaxID=3117733 RepID=UPI002F260515